MPVRGYEPTVTSGTVPYPVCPEYKQVVYVSCSFQPAAAAAATTAAAMSIYDYRVGCWRLVDGSRMTRRRSVA